ncbi:hypothetical protein ABXN37_13105 [Piscinibacter sakaiensis]|uniref:hypothetical protein n=1 Tax=Piscinibacter sakaiensis TaxID=1547922 RepID=UPI00372724A5
MPALACGLSSDETPGLHAGTTQTCTFRTPGPPPRAARAAALAGAAADRHGAGRDGGAGGAGARRGLEQELAGSRATIAGLREDVASALAALPPDPRGGAVEVRAGRFSVDGGQLVYDVVLSRERGNPGRPFQGVMQFVVAGDGARGNGSVALKPLPVSIGHYQSLRGSLPLPPDFRPSQATIRVLDRPDGRQQGMRVMLVK